MNKGILDPLLETLRYQDLLQFIKTHKLQNINWENLYRRDFGSISKLQDQTYHQAYVQQTKYMRHIYNILKNGDSDTLKSDMRFKLKNNIPTLYIQTNEGIYSYPTQWVYSYMKYMGYLN